MSGVLTKTSRDTPPSGDEKLYYCSREAANLLSVSRRTILEALKAGKLDGFVRGRRAYFTRQGLLDWFHSPSRNMSVRSMASVRKEKDRGREGYRLQVYLPTAKRASLWLGNISKRQANEICLRIDQLVQSVRLGVEPPVETVDWAIRCGKRLQDRLIDWQVIQPESIPVSAQPLREFTEAWLEVADKGKDGTRRNYDNTIDLLCEHLGEDRPVDTISADDAAAWVRWMADERERKLAPTTRGKVIQIAKRIFNWAVEQRQIRRNPFSELESSTTTLPGRKIYVTRETTQAILDSTACHQWRCIIALARFGGLRVPSEVLALKWADINWERGRFLVHSRKTEHHVGKETRVVPLFPELRDVLWAAHELAEDGDVYVITRYRSSGKYRNIGTQFKRLVKRAGEKPWTKPFVNMRASCRVDLEVHHPSHVIDAWLGHTYKVAKKHYLMPREDDFVRAAGGVVGGVTKCTPVSQGG